LEVRKGFFFACNPFVLDIEIIVVTLRKFYGQIQIMESYLQNKSKDLVAAAKKLI
jgi:hypothetical protein